SEVLAELRRLGVKGSLDDFGTGYASLAHLHELPVDAMKLDRAFLDTAPGRRGHGGQRALLQAVPALGTASGAEVPAEGVETEEQLRQVIAAGCDSVQGFLVSQPVAPALIQDAARLGGAVLDRVRASRRHGRARPGAGGGGAAARCSVPAAWPGPSLPRAGPAAPP